MVAFLVVSVSPHTVAADPTPIRFAFSASDADEREELLGMIARFNASQDATQVLPVPRQWQGYGIFDTYVRFLALQDPSIDVYLVDLPWIPEFAQPGWLTPLDGMLSSDELASIAPNALEWGRYQGQLYGLPTAYKGNLLFYRKDLLRAAGFEAPKTVDELAHIARALQEQGHVEVGLALHALYFHNDVFPFFFAHGGSILSPDNELTLASPQNIRVLEALVELFRGTPPVVPRNLFEGAWASSYTAPLEAFLAGDAAFLICWSRDWHRMQSTGSAVQGRVGIAAVPGLEPTDPGGASMGSWYMTISAASRHPEEALDFIQFATSPEQQRRQLERLSEVPTQLSLLRDETLLEEHPHVRDMAAILSRAGARPRVPDERAFDAVIERHLHRAVRGESTPEEALRDAEAELTKRLATQHPRAPVTLELPPWKRLATPFSPGIPWRWPRPLPSFWWCWSWCFWGPVNAVSDPCCAPSAASSLSSPLPCVSSSSTSPRVSF